LCTRNVDIVRFTGSANFYDGNRKDKFIHTVEKMHQQDITLKTRESTSKPDEELRNDESPQILIVDDSPEILNLLTDILTYHGYRVRAVSSGNIALKSVTEDTPDMILLDVNMPVMDGYEVCNFLKSNENTSKIPVIFISGLDDAADKVRGFNAGGVDYITKPFQLAEVLARIETHLSLRRLQNQSEGQNIQLQQEIAERELAEKELREHKAHLEELVAERTSELRNTNAELQKEISEREQLERALEQTNYKLHALVYEYGLRNQRISLFNQMSEQLQGCLSLEETLLSTISFRNYFLPQQELFLCLTL
jgi:DNA-binding response OmpR family regulator